ncbi:hypothetical protein BV25DRAFT_977434 [Artomyces pyxidatus]|uniref:Uncharacterized protein n=1 Tax=Artomyces pyxidatus TaxID=48021 RepID=A0ACB8SWK5_9AGAM|nr:hypothetical protein BV25DRAFT_977434 [Artomyces pyxidatus]
MNSPQAPALEPSPRRVGFDCRLHLANNNVHWRLVSVAGHTVGSHSVSRLEITTTTMSHPDHSLTIPLIDFLQQPLVTSLLATHPNNIYSSTSPPFEIPPAWDSWWDWYATMEGESQKWVNLLEVYYGDAKGRIPTQYLMRYSTSSPQQDACS